MIGRRIYDLKSGEIGTITKVSFKFIEGNHHVIVSVDLEIGYDSITVTRKFKEISFFSSYLEDVT